MISQLLLIWAGQFLWAKRVSGVFLKVCHLPSSYYYQEMIEDIFLTVSITYLPFLFLVHLIPPSVPLYGFEDAKLMD